MPTAQPTGKIHGERKDWTDNQTRTENSWLTDVRTLNPNMIRKPDYFVYLFTVADRPFTIARPTLNISKMVIPACAPDKNAPDCPNAMLDTNAYRLVWRIPSPYNAPYSDQTTGAIKLPDPITGEWAATDICNPNQKELDPNAFVDPYYQIGEGDNLYAKGLFYAHEDDCTFVGPDGKPCKRDLKDEEGRLIAYPVPPKKFIDAAHSRKRNYYQHILDKINGLERSNPVEMQNWLIWEPDAHLACEFFKIETSWHKFYQQKPIPAQCKNCGSDMLYGAAYHALPGSKLGVCVNDWERAIEAGVVSEEDRPKKKQQKVEPVVPTV